VEGGSVSGEPPTDDALLEAALEVARGLASSAEPSGVGLTWHAEIVAGIDEDAPVIGHGDVGASLYDGTSGIALSLAGCATVAAPPEATRFAEAARGAARHALSTAQDLLDADRLGLFNGATGIALGVVTAGRSLGDSGLVDGGAALADAVAARLVRAASVPTNGTEPELDLIGGLAGTLLGLQSIARTLGEAQPTALLDVGGQRLVAAAVPQTWGAAWPGQAPVGPGLPLAGLGHGAAGIALALGEIAAQTQDTDASRACAQGLEYERGWFDPDRVAWPDLRAVDADGEPAGWMAAWCHGAVGIGLSRLRLARLSGEALALVESSAALQAARDLVVGAGTALRAGQPSDCTACHGLAGVVELLLVAGRALGAAEHASAARRVARLLLEQRNAADGSWPCGLPGAGEIPGLMTGTAGIALTLLRAARATDVPTPLLPGPSGW
jgi:lantibiotic modifying enzyme